MAAMTEEDLFGEDASMMDQPSQEPLKKLGDIWR